MSYTAVFAFPGAPGSDFPLRSKRARGLSQTITSGIAVPEQLAFDSAGNLYVANQFAGVTIYATPYSGAPQSSTNGVLVPLGVAVQPGTLCSSTTKSDC